VARSSEAGCRSREPGACEPGRISLDRRAQPCPQESLLPTVSCLYGQHQF